MRRFVPGELVKHFRMIRQVGLVVSVDEYESHVQYAQVLFGTWLRECYAPNLERVAGDERP